MATLTAHFDGECRKPPHASGGPCRAAWLIEIDGQKKTGIEVLPEGTVNFSELAALVGLLKALKEVEPMAGYDLVIRGDSDIAVNAVLGLWNVRAEYLVNLVTQAQALLVELRAAWPGGVNLVLIGRKENRAHALLHPSKKLGKRHAQPIGPKMPRGRPRKHIGAAPTGE